MHHPTAPGDGADTDDADTDATPTIPADPAGTAASGAADGARAGRSSAGEQSGGAEPTLDVDRRHFLAGAAGTAAAAAAGATPAAAGSFTTTDVTITSHDGTDLAATLYRPDATGPHPAVLMTHGWGSDRGSDRVVRKAETYAANGYVVLTYDSRGFGASGGVVGLDGPNEVSDVSHLIDWLAGRSEVAMDAAGDPTLGMDGYSYSGAIQLLAAAADDRIDAVVPRITWNDLNYATEPHGVVKVGWLTALLALGTIDTWEFDSGPGLDGDLFEWYLEAAIDNTLPQDAVTAFEERSPAEKMADVDVPTFLMQGWDDTLFKPVEALRTFRSLQAKGVDANLLFYEGGHAVEGLSRTDSESAFMNGLALDFMDKHLKGASVSVPTVTEFLKQPGTWRHRGEFPPADIDTTPLELSATESGDSTFVEEDIWWWNDTSHRFDWTVGADLEVIGTSELDIWVRPEGPEERLFFRFYHTDGDGHTRMINDVGETFRVEGADQHHRVQVQFSPIQRFLREGDTISLEVGVSDPFYFDSRESEGTHIMHSSEFPSQFTFPHRQVTEQTKVRKDLAVGDGVHVTINDIEARESAGTGASTITTKKLYTSGQVVGGPTDADGFRWWEVHYFEDGGGFHGWTIEKALDRGVMHTERLKSGDRVAVDTSSTRLNIRDGPGTHHTAIDAAPDGAEGRIVAGPEWADGYAWWQVEYDSYSAGWSAQDFLDRL